jgi:hypothetical protein
VERGRWEGPVAGQAGAVCTRRIPRPWPQTRTDQGTRRESENGSAHDQRIGQEPWAWLAPISDEELSRDWARVTAHMTLSLEADLSADRHRGGDLVVYCGGDGEESGVNEGRETTWDRAAPITRRVSGSVLLALQALPRWCPAAGALCREDQRCWHKA